MKMYDGMKLDGEKWVFLLDGKEVTEEEYRRRYPLPESRPGDIVGGTPTRGWPIRSTALAVHPEQVDEANARNKQAGINVRYEPGTGVAIIPDRQERRKLLKEERVVDRDSYTGY
jgi:hypothetical protein